MTQTLKTLSALGGVVNPEHAATEEQTTHVTATVTEEVDDMGGVVETRKSKKRKPVAPESASVGAAAESADPETADTTQVEDESQPEDDAGTVDDSTVLVEDKQVVEQAVVRLMYVKCHACRHLMPTMPDQLPKSLGGGKLHYGREFDCYTEDGCPARYLTLEFSPFTDEVIDEAVAAFKATGDLATLEALYTEARNTSKAIWKDVHTRVTAALRD